MTWLLKIKEYLVALGVIIVGFLSFYLWGRWKGSSAATTRIENADAIAQADAIKEQTDTLQEVKTHVQDLHVAKVPITVPPNLPASDGAQQVGSAQSGTAAGDLKKDWMIK